MVSVATPSERTCNPIWRQLLAQRAKIAISFVQCVDIGVLVLAKVVCVSEKWLIELVLTFLCI